MNHFLFGSIALKDHQFPVRKIESFSTWQHETCWLSCFTCPRQPSSSIINLSFSPHELLSPLFLPPPSLSLSFTHTLPLMYLSVVTDKRYGALCKISRPSNPRAGRRREGEMKYVFFQIRENHPNKSEFWYLTGWQRNPSFLNAPNCGCDTNQIV